MNNVVNVDFVHKVIQVNFDKDIEMKAGQIIDAAAEAYRSAEAAHTSEVNAAESETNAAVSATAAATSATNAANSASSASASASSASTSATNAANSATLAAGSATNAATSETNASNSASSASMSASSASTSAANAANSAADAAESAMSAATSAGAASADANTATNAMAVVNTELPQILSAATSASSSAASAQASAAAAALSAGTATTQAQIATNAASSASDDADDAADSAAAAAASASAAATSATQAETANTEAKYYAKVTMDKVAESAVGYPSQSGTLTYDGTEQTPTWDVFYEPQKMTVTGTTAATNAGTYTITMTPKSTYYWWDTGTTAARTQTWTIGRQAIENVPSQSGAVVYDGTEQSPTWANYDSTKMTIGGITAATEVGTYTATFTPKANYKWSDGTTTAKEVTWSISALLVAVPTVTDTALTYNGAAQGPTIGTYDPLLIDVTGDSATNAGNYAVVFHLKNASTTWADGTTADKSVTWSIAVKTVAIPAVTDTSKTYNGNSQSPTISSYSASEITVGGTTSATNAGNYTVTFTLTSETNYKWSDNTTATKSAGWSIAAKAVTVPTLSNTSKTYNGSPQSPTISSYSASEIAVGGTTSATNAGNYTVTFTLKNVTNYKWSDNTTAAKSAAWSIAKAAGSMSLSKSSVSLTTSQLTDTVTVTRSGDGAVSATSSDTSIATVSVSGTTVTVTAVANGSATVTVSVAAGTNYLAPSSKTVSVACNLVPALNDCTWAQISEIAQAGTGPNYWDVGDVKMITLNGKVGNYFTATNLSLGVFILDFNRSMYVQVDDSDYEQRTENNIIFGGFKTALSNGTDVCLCDSDYGKNNLSGLHFNMNHAYTNRTVNFGGWKGTDLRYDILGATSQQPSRYNTDNETNVGYNATASTLTSPKANTLLAALPSDFRSVLRLWNRYLDCKGYDANSAGSYTYPKISIDAITLLCASEILASSSYANDFEANYNPQMPYYVSGNSKTKYKQNAPTTSAYWLTSSPSVNSINNPYGYCCVDGEGIENTGTCNVSFGLAPAFKV